MKTLFKISLAGLLIISQQVACQQLSAVRHPCLYVTNDEKASIKSKIKNEAWAEIAWESLCKSIDPIVNRHMKDPEWIVSRMAMYWKEEEHYTQCFVKNQNWDSGTGNAPVPTVRLPGMRVWNDYQNVPLADRIPYNETGDMKAVSRADPSAPAVIVPYKNSGHLIRGNNTEILGLAEKAAFAYWLTGNENYAKFSADIFWTWLLGTYYMNPPYDQSRGGKDGYQPGGIMGYYDYEQIHDDLQIFASSTYDFLYDYLNKHPHEHLKVIGKNTTEVAGEVFKRFINLGLVRGGRTGNWNTNGFEMITRSYLVLESNDYYADGKGREYYLPFYTTTSTPYHVALPEILKSYDEVTGLWPESPGYASGTISSLLNMAMPIYKNGVNTIRGNPMMQKAAMANLNWIDARGNLIIIGDSRGGPLSYSVFERLLTYYTWEKDMENAKKVASVLQKGIASGDYDRSETNWIGICLNAPLPDVKGDIPYKRAAYSPVHRLLIFKNGNDEENGLMFILYGGETGKHLSPNGLAMQLYYKGWALAPDAAAYESYWSSDNIYHQSVTGANTIIPGYSTGPIVINAMDPSPGPKEFTNSVETSAICSFADVTANEKRRLVGMVRTSSTTGYYIDIFRSDQNNNDYLYHNLGNNAEIFDASGTLLEMKPVNDLGTEYHKGYPFFINQKKISYTSDFLARWNIAKVSPSINMDMWMMGQNNRELYLVDAPPSTLIGNVTPGQVNKSPETTPALIVRQNGNNAKVSPFVAVFEPYSGQEKSIRRVSNLSSSGNFVGILVESQKPAVRKEFICNAIDDDSYSPTDDLTFRGIFGIAAEKADGFHYLYLGQGKLLKKGKFSIESVDGDVSAELILRDGGFYYSANKPVKISINAGKLQEFPAGYNIRIK